jgi:hypothetical protein
VAEQRQLKDGEHRAGEPEAAVQPPEVRLSTERDDDEGAADTDDRGDATSNRVPGPQGHTAP